MSIIDLLKLIVKILASIGLGLYFFLILWTYRLIANPGEVVLFLVVTLLVCTLIALNILIWHS